VKAIAHSQTVMRAHSRPREGVASLAYDARIHDDMPASTFIVLAEFTTSARSCMLPEVQ